MDNLLKHVKNRHYNVIQTLKSDKGIN